MSRAVKSKVPASHVSDKLSKTKAPSSAESTPPEVVTITNKNVNTTIPVPSITNEWDLLSPSAVVSGAAEGVGIVPPPTAAIRCSGVPQLSDRVQHSLKRSFESEELPGLLSRFVHFVKEDSTKKRAPVVSPLFQAPAALGAPPPDDSLNPLTVGPARAVEGSVSSALSYSGLGLDQNLNYPSMTAERDWKERSLRFLSRVPVESQTSSVNSSGMLNQTGLVDRHTLPLSLPLPSCSSVPAASLFADPYAPSVEDYGGAVPAFVESFELEDPEGVDPYATEFYPTVASNARDPIFNSVSAGIEAEAMILKYGGDFAVPEEPASMATAQPASLFCDAVPVDTGIKLLPDFAREYDRVSVTDINRQSCAAVGRNFRISGKTAQKLFVTEKASPELMALGASLAESNPLKATTFREEDLRWAKNFRFSAFSL